MPAYPLDKLYHPDFARKGRKPVGPVEIDWSNPLTRGLRCVVLPQGRGIFQIITRSGTVTIDNNSGLSGGVVAGEFGVKGFTNSTYANTATQTDFFEIGNWSKWAVVTGLAVSSTSGTAWDVADDTTTNTNFALQFSTSGRCSLFNRGGTGSGLAVTNFPAAVNLADGKRHQLIFTQGTSRLRGIADGIHDSWWTGTTNSPSTSGNVFTLGRLGDSTPSTYWNDTNGLIEYIFLYDRDLYEDGTYKSLYKDPYQILKPAVDVMAFWASAGGGTTYNVSFSLGMSNGLSHSGQATAQAGIVLAQDVGMQDGSNATAQGNATIAAQLGLSVTSQVTFDVDVSLNTSMGISTSANATAQAALPINLTLDQTVSALAQAIATISFSQNNSAGFNIAGSTVEASIAMALNMGLTNTVNVTLSGAITLNADLAAQLQANANTLGSLDLGMQVGVQIAAKALAEAGITISAITSVTMTGSSILVGIVTPDERSYTIEIDNREFLILAENRDYEVK